MKKVKIEFGWRLWSLIVCALILIGVAGFSYATNSGNPAIMGHTADEIAGGAGNSAGSNFGARENKSINTVYQANTDGFVIVDFACNQDSCNTRITAYVGSTNSPNTRIARSYVSNGGWGDTMTFPVLKGEYWKVSTDNGANIAYNSFYYIPLN